MAKTQSSKHIDKYRHKQSHKTDEESLDKGMLTSAERRAARKVAALLQDQKQLHQAESEEAVQQALEKMAKNLVSDLFEQVVKEEWQKQQSGQKGKLVGRNGDKKKTNSFTLQKFYEKTQEAPELGHEDSEKAEATCESQEKNQSASEELELTTGGEGSV